MAGTVTLTRRFPNPRFNPTRHKMKTLNPPSVTRSGSPLTPRLLHEILAPAKAGESTTLDGPVQIGAMLSRSRNGGFVKVRMDGHDYTVQPHPDNAQHFQLAPVGSFSRGGLSWGYLAFSSAVESGQIKYI